MMPQPPGLYLHLPFCSAICPYCDFAVLTGDAGRKRQFFDLTESWRWNSQRRPDASPRSFFLLEKC